MLSGWDAAAQAQLQGGQVRLGVFLLVMAATPLRAWSGVGEATLPADAVEPTGGTYLGVGALIGVPALQQLVNGQAERVEFTVAGVTPEIVRLADAEADTVRNVPALVGVRAFGSDEQPISPVAWLWEGEADRVRAARTTGEGGQVTRAVTLSVGSMFTGRRRPPLNHFTDADQRRRSPTDRFFDRVGGYTQATTKKWPN